MSVGARRYSNSRAMKIEGKKSKNKALEFFSFGVLDIIGSRVTKIAFFFVGHLKVRRIYATIVSGGCSGISNQRIDG